MKFSDLHRGVGYGIRGHDLVRPQINKASEFVGSLVLYFNFCSLKFKFSVIP